MGGVCHLLVQPTHPLPKAGAPLPGLTQQLGQGGQGQARSGPVNSIWCSFHRPRSQPNQSPGAQWARAFLTSVSSHPLFPSSMPPVGSSLQAFGMLIPTFHVTGTKEAGHPG